MSNTPAELGYRWPAEWEPQRGVWLSWPRNPDTWPGKFEPVPAEYAALATAIAEFEPVHILAGGTVLEQARELVGHVQHITLHDILTNDSWMRDHGPSFLAGKNLPPALVDWEYNAWGGKYPPFDLDNQVPAAIAEITGRRRFTPGIIMEGGAIETNGRGTLLTTASCLLNPNRNPHLSREAVERCLCANLGVSHIAWLRGGEVAGDDTDGHIDQLARFVNPTTILCATCDDAGDENVLPTRQNFEELRSLVDQAGRPFEVIPLPLPGPLFYEGQRLPASYCNFLIVNDAVIVPQFGDRSADARALAILAEHFPGRVMRGVPSLDLVWGLGSFHCLSQQETLADA